MKCGSLLHLAGVLVSSFVSMLPHPSHAKVEEFKNGKESKKSRESQMMRTSPSHTASATSGMMDPPRQKEKYPWKQNIVTTTFWVGETPTKNNPVPNDKSSWDVKWSENFGGYDTPDKSKRAPDFTPASFTPKQNPFYVALPYNDKSLTGHKAEAANVIPWFKQEFKGPGKSVCKGRWIAIRHGDKVCYAQWEDAGPFRTDHWQYVFGDERPKPNLNKGAGLDVSPAVRDFLGMSDTDVTDWRFVEFDEVPSGPWAWYGDNNTFVMNRRAQQQKLAQAKQEQPATAMR
jgi:hypothetical protein